MSMKQNSILNYFQRTPKQAKAASDGNGGNSSKGESNKKNSSAAKPSRNGGDGVGDSPESVGGSPTTVNDKVNGKSEEGGGGTTPVSSRNSHSVSKRRPKKDGNSTDSVKKRPRIEESPPLADGKEFTNGAVVWAKLEGYPWWPAMIRGEHKNSKPHRKNRTEYHVQFFDQPPSHAWIRKSDVKEYKGSADGAVPPAKSDPNWLECCKYADGVISVSPTKRFERYWVDFPELDGSDSEQEEEDTVSIPTPTNTQPKKRRRVIKDDSSDDDNDKIKKPNGSKRVRDKDEDYQHSSSSSESDVASEIDEVEEDAGDVSEVSLESPEEKIKKNGKKPAGRKSLVAKTLERVKHNVPYRLSPSGIPKTPSTPCASPGGNTSFNSSLIFGSPRTPLPEGKDLEDGREKWIHLGLDFLKPQNIMDARRKKPSDSDYDPKTLYVPSSFKEKCTPAQKQWWDMKANNFDTILFFKVGKFYELYHMDAVVAVQETGIDFMRGELAHCGFPEIAFSKFSNMLVEKGFKVARVEQTETPDMMSERCKKMSKPSKFDRVVKREICQMTTKGVKLATFQDTLNDTQNYNASYLFAICDKPVEHGMSEVGVCFVDTKIGKFRIGQFRDDRIFSRLRTLFSHYSPSEVLFEKRKIPSGIQNLLSTMTTVRKNALVPETEFWGEKKTLKDLREEKYFWNETLERNVPPESLMQFISKNDHLSLTAEDGFELGVRSLGAVIWYLKSCLVEFDLLSMKDFELYQPLDASEDSARVELARISERLPKNMILDSTTLKNLNITNGPVNLLSKIDYCSTVFGRRLLRSWVCMPLGRPEEISRRLDAVEDLRRLRDLTEQSKSVLTTLPDLELLMSKVHTLGSEHRGKDHPDSRAFFFEEAKYSRRKVTDLTTTLQGFKASTKIIDLFKARKDELQSDLLISLVDNFPALDELLHYFDNAFDHSQAAKDGKIIPSAGVDMQYDSLCQWQNDIQTESAAYLRCVGKQLQTTVIWFGSDKKRFQLEVPERVRVPHDFEMSSSKKGFKRYYTDEAKKFLERTMKMEASRQGILKDLMRRVFEKVDSHRSTWSQAVTIIAQLDALISLAEYSSMNANMCRPRVVHSAEPFINMEGGRHPCIVDESFIPNNSSLGTFSSEEEPKGVFTLLTGPNMGGKSTLMRQVGLLVVLTQIGSFVPAFKFEMSAVDRIFTRVGANDDLTEGESTFFVEMSETSTILKHSTRDSLVLVDELGRGTATYDGTAIAYAVAKNLGTLGSRCYFSTHYHHLVETVSHMPSIQLGHMACVVEKENEDDPTEESLTFLYKLVPGAANKSYGFNAARIAGLPADIVRVANKKACELAQNAANANIFRQILSRTSSLSLNEAKGLEINL